jgi:predicted amidohydrolase YtcJ
VRDLLVIGRIYTMDPANPVARGAVIRLGRFAWVGDPDECAARASADATRLHLGQGSAVPGLADSHGHVLWYGRSKLEVNCEGLASEAECAERVAARARLIPPGQWILGRGWDHNRWPGASFPTEGGLSRVARSHPVALWRVDGHALWVNAQALALAGIGASTPDPPGGRIVCYPDGRPSGVLVDRAVDLVVRKIPPLAPAEIEMALEVALQDLARAGLTAVHDAGVSPEGLEAYRGLALEDRLPLRVYAMIDGQAPRETLEQQLAHWKSAPEVGRLTVRAVKLFADGALGSRGAMLREPYSDDPANTGLFLMAPDELRERIGMVARAGFQPAVHAIGDRAVGEVLEAFAAVGGELDLASLRPRIEHLQTLVDHDLPLLAKVRPVASMQPIHAVSDALWAEERLGHGTPRQKGAYAWRRVLDRGAPLAFGSDFPVESFDPRLGLHAAELRLPRGASAPWMPEQCLSRTEALRAYTEGAATAALADGRRGRVKVGYDADLTVFDEDILAITARELPRLEVTHTVVSGTIEYAACAQEKDR